MSDTPRITIQPDGPYMVTGSVPLLEKTIAPDGKGQSVAWEPSGDFPDKTKYALCRCGQSGNKPFCDNSHAEAEFDGTETASREPYVQQAKRMEGPRYTLLDAEELCALARFCDTHQTVWDEVEDTDDPEVAAVFLGQIANCVSGRLVAVDNETGEQVEVPREQTISATQDPAEECSGPLWVEGGIEVIGSDGEAYERRQRIALCRCGASGNKPFCDGTHTKIGWTDGNLPDG